MHFVNLLSSHLNPSSEPLSALLAQTAPSRSPNRFDLKQQMSSSFYAGKRILEAMHSAPRYADAVYSMARTACGNVNGTILDFGAGDGVFVDKFFSERISVDCVEPDPGNQSRLKI